MPQATAGPPPMLAGRYELGPVLGRGSVGVVHRGRDVVLDRPVAVKMFAHDASDPNRAVRYEQEARLLARLSHPGLVTVFDAGIDAAGSDGAQPYLVMELVPGRTLADRIHGAPLPTPQIAGIAAELATALGYIHRRGIVHRDIKPANILLQPSEVEPGVESAKLTDFGIARLVDGARMTMSGYTLGTPNYLSPEQVTGGDVSAASDVYSLGLVLLECFTGALAYPGHGVEAAVARLHRAPVMPDSVPDGWARLLGAMTDKQPTARPAASEVGVAVTGLADAGPGGSLPAGVAAAQADAQQTAFLARVGPDGPGPLPTSPTGTGTADGDESAPGPQATRMMPAVPPRRSTGLRRRLGELPPWAFVVAAAAAVVLIIVIVLASSGGGTSGVPSPAYPSVPGQLGSDLHTLQQDLAP